jgi:hypothetical protein
LSDIQIPHQHIQPFLVSTDLSVFLVMRYHAVPKAIQRSDNTGKVTLIDF